MGEKTLNSRYLEAEERVFASHSLKPRVQQLRLRNPSLTVHTVEVGAGEPQLYLHGFSFCTAYWASLMAQIPSLRSIAIDLPGHGGSDGADFRGVDLRRWYQNLLTSCLDELGIDSAHFVGHSGGAMAAMWLALDQPQRVRSLVSIGTPGVAFGAISGPLGMLALPVIGPLMLSMPMPQPIYRRSLAIGLGGHAVDSMPEELVRASYLATRGPSYTETVSTSFREMFSGLKADPPRYALNADELRRIRQPALIIWGRKDIFMSVANGKSKAGLMPNARFEVVEGGHIPWLDNLERCVEPMQTFLSA